jgi:hypothetical protein
MHFTAWRLFAQWLILTIFFWEMLFSPDCAETLQHFKSAQKKRKRFLAPAPRNLV